MLDHAGEALVLLTGFWRFVVSARFRRRKLEEWREMSASVGGRLTVAAEILVGLLIGLGLPALIVAFAVSLGGR